MIPYNRNFLMLLITILVISAFAMPERTPGKGIAFFKGTFTEALALSRESGKPLFIDCYATWCGPCRQLERTTFRDKAMGDYFNANFICIRIDGETAEGKTIRNAYSVDSYPTLLITDGNGRLLTRTEGHMKPYILINFGRRIVP